MAEHAPHGPTEEQLVEELAGILWCKRRLRLAEAAAHRPGLEGALDSYRKIVKVALVHLDATDQSERVVDAIRATTTDTEEDICEMQEDEAMTRRALEPMLPEEGDYLDGMHQEQTILDPISAIYGGPRTKTPTTPGQEVPKAAHGRRAFHMSAAQLC